MITRSRASYISALDPSCPVKSEEPARWGRASFAYGSSSVATTLAGTGRSAVLASSSAAMAVSIRQSRFAPMPGVHHRSTHRPVACQVLGKSLQTLLLTSRYISDQRQHRFRADAVVDHGARNATHSARSTTGCFARGGALGEGDPAGNLGVLRAGQGDPAGAAAAYELAIAFRHADVTPKAAFNLGWLRAGHGDPAGAAAAYQLAIDSGHADLARRAAVNLGVLRKEQGDPARSAAAYQQGTCEICHRKFREERRWLIRLHGGPRRRCTDRKNCWNAYLARSGFTASMPPKMPAFLLRRGKALYRGNVDDLLKPFTERARSEGRMVSDAELAEIHSRSMQRALNDLSRTSWRGL
jgi:hypothetical protein